LANHVSAQKRARQTVKITERNKHYRSTMRTHVKRVRAAVAAGNKPEAQAALKDCIQQIDKAVGKGLWHKNAGARYVSRLTLHVNKL
jgi:small subunit ribosomal protein S20